MKIMEWLWKMLGDPSSNLSFTCLDKPLSKQVENKKHELTKKQEKKRFNQKIISCHQMMPNSFGETLITIEMDLLQQINCKDSSLMKHNSLFHLRKFTISMTHLMCKIEMAGLLNRNLSMFSLEDSSKKKEKVKWKVKKKWKQWMEKNRMTVSSEHIDI